MKRRRRGHRSLRRFATGAIGRLRRGRESVHEAIPPTAARACTGKGRSVPPASISGSAHEGGLYSIDAAGRSFLRSAGFPRSLCGPALGAAEGWIFISPRPPTGGFLDISFPRRSISSPVAHRQVSTSGSTIQLQDATGGRLSYEDFAVARSTGGAAQVSQNDSLSAY